MIHSIIESPVKNGLDLDLLSQELQLGQRQVSELLGGGKVKTSTTNLTTCRTRNRHSGKFRSILVAGRLQK